MLNWIGMDTETIVYRQQKAREIRICRKYLRRAKAMGLTPKSTTVRYWTRVLEELRNETDL